MSAVSGRVNFEHHDVALLTERAAVGDRTLRINGKMLAQMVDRKVARGAEQSPSRNGRAGAQGWPDHLVPGFARSPMTLSKPITSLVPSVSVESRFVRASL